MSTRDAKARECIEQIQSSPHLGEDPCVKRLIKEYERSQKALDKIVKISDKQQLVLKEAYKELDLYKNHLEERVEEEIQKRKEKELILLRQSKFAAMGEMIDAIAHQWKQPIGAIRLHAEIFEYDFEDGDVDMERMREFQRDLFAQLDHITATLDDFRGFFRPNRKPECFSVQGTIRSVMVLVKDEFIKNKIEFIVENGDDFTIEGVENEFKHLILNIINNAKDAFNENDIKERLIRFRVLDGEDGYALEIDDNAGGIPEEVLPNILKANFTTKEEGEGTGIGLYMSSQIAEKLNGSLSAENIEGGARFRFKLGIERESL